MHDARTGLHSRQGRPAQIATVALCLAVLFLASLDRLRDLIVSEADEGTYVYAGRLVAAGRSLYSDFMLAHPPLLILFVAGVWKLLPGLMAARVAYVLVITLGWIPLYGVGKIITHSHRASLAAVAITACGYLFAANMGRTVRLEPFANVFLFSGAWALYSRPRGRASNVLAGVLFGLGALVKLVAIVPVGLLFVADVAWPTHEAHASRNAERVGRWSLVALGGALVLIPASIVLIRTPGFKEWAIDAQSHRPAAALGFRLYALGEGFARFPPYLLALVVSVAVVARSPSAAARAVSLVGLGTAILTAFAFRSYARYYVVLAAPWSVLALVEFVGRRWASTSPRALAASWWSTMVLAGLVGPFAFSEGLYRFSSLHVLGPKRILPLLEHRSGFLLTRSPDFALYARRDLYPWYYVVDWFLPRETGRLGDKEFGTAVDGCDTLVLYRGEFDSFTTVTQRLLSDFNEDYIDENWEVWRRKTTALSPPYPGIVGSSGN